MIIVHAGTMIILYACIMIIGHACTMIAEHVSCPTGLMFNVFEGGGMRGEALQISKWAGGRRPRDDGLYWIAVAAEGRGALPATPSELRPKGRGFARNAQEAYIKGRGGASSGRAHSGIIYTSFGLPPSRFNPMSMLSLFRHEARRHSKKEHIFDKMKPPSAAHRNKSQNPTPTIISMTTYGHSPKTCSCDLYSDLYCWTYMHELASWCFASSRFPKQKVALASGRISSNFNLSQH